MKEIKDLRILNHKVCKSFENPFFTHHKYSLKNVYTDGSQSREYSIEFFDRKGFDCVAVIPFYRKDGTVYVGFLKAFRPSIYFRKDYPLPLKDERVYRFVYESVAGSLEEGDKGMDKVIKRVVEELKEEAGFVVNENEIFSLGGSFFPSHGQSTEKIHLFAVNVENALKINATGDGSVNEELNRVIFKPLDTVLEMCFKGEIEDPKIEIGVNRLKSWFLTDRDM